MVGAPSPAKQTTPTHIKASMCFIECHAIVERGHSTVFEKTVPVPLELLSILCSFESTRTQSPDASRSGSLHLSRSHVKRVSPFDEHCFNCGRKMCKPDLGFCVWKLCGFGATPCPSGRFCRISKLTGALTARFSHSEH